MERPKKFAPLAPVILGRDAQSVPRILWHQGRCNLSPPAGEGDALASGEGYLNNMQKALSMLLQHLCNNKANLLTRFETRCQKILGTDCASRPKMTGAGDVDLFPSVSFVLKVLLLKVSFFLPNPAKTC